MLARILATLRADHALIAISANGPADRFARFGLPVLPDGDLAGHGPLAGLHAGLTWARASGARALLSVPGDTPFIPPGLAARLAPAPACAASTGGVHHLVALWPTDAAPTLRRWLAGGHKPRVGAFAATLDMRVVDMTTTDHDPFLNINTPEDLEQARRHATERPSP